MSCVKRDWDQWEELREMHPLAEDEEIEKWKSYLFEESSFIQSPLLDELLFDDLGAGIGPSINPDVRAAVMARANYRCENCGASAAEVRLTLHHRHYRSVDAEIPSDLAALCWPCHKAKHRPYGEYVKDVHEHDLEEEERQEYFSWLMDKGD